MEKAAQDVRNRWEMLPGIGCCLRLLGMCRKIKTPVVAGVQLR